MRICYVPGCDEAAAVWFHGARCGAHALAMIEAPLDGHARPPRRLGGQASAGGSLPASEPALSVDDLLEILAMDGWREVEFDLMTRHGMTLADLERRLRDMERELSEA